jgi:HAD superfamily hydrolase (TIGR01509 family)
MSTLDASRVRAVLFDIDGTLADTDDQAVRFAARVLAPLGIVSSGSSDSRLARRLVMAAEGPVNALLTLADRLMVDELVGPLLESLDRRRAHETGGSPALIPDVEGLLERLAAVYPLAIITTRGDVRTRRFLTASHLDRFFSTVVTARSTRRTKPHPEPVVRAAQELGLAPQDCVVVGDTTVDIRAGRAAGAQTIGVLCGFGERAELERAGANLIVTTTADLASVLLEA